MAQKTIPVTLIGFSAVNQIAKFEHKVGDEKTQARKKRSLLGSIDSLLL